MFRKQISFFTIFSLALLICISFFSLYYSIDVSAAGKPYVVVSERSSADGAQLLQGREFNAKIKQLVASSSKYTTQNSKIHKIVFMSQGEKKTAKGTNVESYLSGRGVTPGYDAYAYLEDSAVYIYTRANKFLFNANSDYMFYYLKLLTSVEFGNKTDSSNMVSASAMFESCYSIKKLDVSKLDVSSVSSFTSMFCDCESLESLDLRSWKTKCVNDMNRMFDSCLSIKSIQFGSGFDTSNVTDMSYMFLACRKLTSLDVSSFNTQNVHSFTMMFALCENLKNLDVSNFNTANAQDMRDMLSGCISLVSLDVSKFDTSNAADMSGMFSGCRSLKKLNVSNFDTSKTTTMYGIFYGCDELETIDISKWAVNDICDVDDMFRDCYRLKRIDAPKDLELEIDLPYTYYLDDNKDGVADSAKKYSKIVAASHTHRYIQEYDIDKFVIEYTPVFDYEGSAITPEVVVRNGETALKEGTDYSVKYSNNINSGKATVTVQGKGYYKNKVTKTFKIYARYLVDVTCSLSDNEMLYDGQEKQPLPTLKFNGKTLVKGTDYTVKYSDNINPGQGNATITGRGNFTGEVNLPFTIKMSVRDAHITLNESVFMYDGSEKKPSVTSVTVNGKTLEKRVDYRVVYSNNKNLGIGVVTVIGKGYYCDSASCSFKIIKGSGHTLDDGETFVSRSFNYTVTDSEDHELELVSCNQKLKEVVIPGTVKIGGVKYKVTSIGDKAFYKDTTIQSLTIPNSVQSIESYAFYGCTNLKKVRIGKGLEELGASCFRKCTKLEEITLPKSMDEIEKYAFKDCKRLKKLNINAKSVVDIEANAITGTSKKLVINVPNSLIQKYRKLFTGRIGFLRSMKII